MIKLKTCCVGLLPCLLLIACSSVKKVAYSSDANPAVEISKMDNDVNQGLAKQYDVVAPDAFEHSQEYLKKAKTVKNKQGKLRRLWSNLGYSRAYLNRAKDAYDRRHEKIEGVLKARQTAIDLGARKYDITRDEISALDDGFRSNVSSLDRGRYNKSVWERAERNYQALGIRTLQESLLGEARNRIEDARKHSGMRYTPKTYRNAVGLYQEALKQVAQHPNDDSRYQPFVEDSLKAARNLTAVLAAARHARGTSNEQIAREMLSRERAVENLNQQLKGAEVESSANQARVKTLTSEQEAFAKEQKLNDSLEKAREALSAEDADVYRQGDKLIIRLKTLSFPFASSNLPSKSLPLLSRVKSIVKDLDPAEIVVEGHTDSIGSAKINQTLSQKRAQAVADYLKTELADTKVEAVGQSYDKPLASNKDRVGRAQNRRVDLIVTPSAATSEEPAPMMPSAVPPATE